MAIHPSKLGRISLAKQADWGTMQTSFPAASYAEVEVGLPTITREALSTDAFRGMFHSQRISAGSRAGATISLRMPLHGWSASTPTADPVAGDQHVESILLEAALGAVFTHDVMSRTVDSYSAGPPGVLATSSAMSDIVGSAVLAATSSSVHSVCWVKSQSHPDLVDLSLTSPANTAPVAGQALYGSLTHYMSTNQPGVGLSLEYLGADSTSRLILFDGCVSRVKLTVAPQAQPVLEADLHFADWSLVGSGGDPGMYSFGLPQLPASVGSNGSLLRINGTSVDALSAEFEVSCEYTPVLNHSSSEGISRYIITDRTVAMTMESAASAVNDTYVYAPGTELDYVQLDINANVPGQAVSILVPKAVITAQSTLGDADGIVSISSQMSAAYYDGDATASSVTAGSGATVPADTVARVAFM